MLAAEREFEVVAEAEDGRTRVELGRAPCSPNVVVMESHARPHSIEATRQIIVACRPWRLIASPLRQTADAHRSPRCSRPAHRDTC